MQYILQCTPIPTVDVNPNCKQQSQKEDICNIVLFTPSSVSLLYIFMQSSPILSMEPDSGYLFSVCWSPSRPLVFAVGTATGHVLVYDLKVTLTTRHARDGHQLMTFVVTTVRNEELRTMYIWVWVAIHVLPSAGWNLGCKWYMGKVSVLAGFIWTTGFHNTADEPWSFVLAPAQLLIPSLFWLQHSHIKQRVSLDASPHKRAIYSVEYNPKRLVQIVIPDCSQFLTQKMDMRQTGGDLYPFILLT